MSQLIDRLSRVAKKEGQPMGFGAVAVRRKEPPLPIIAHLLYLQEEGLAQEAKERGADALLINLPNEAGGQLLEGIQKTGLPWGALFPEVALDDVRRLGEAGLDFALFPLEEVPASLLRSDEVGKIGLIRDTSLPDSLARGIERMGVDALLLEGMPGAETPLRGRHVMVLNRWWGLVQKPLLVTVSSMLSGEEVAALRDAGATGLMVPLGAKDMPLLSHLHQVVDNLPPPARVPRRALEAILPILREEATHAPEEEDDEDE